VSILTNERNADRTWAGSFRAAQALFHFMNMKLGKAFLSHKVGAVLMAHMPTFAASAFDLRVVIEIDKA
jgi:hypothetical protein